MRTELTADPEPFWAAAQEWLEQEPVLNSVILTNLKSRREGVVADTAAPTWAIVRDGDEIVGVAMRTPPRHAYISKMPPAAVDCLVDALAEAIPDNDGVTGTSAHAHAFAQRWSSRTRCSVDVAMEQRIYQLEKVTPARWATGEFRLAEPKDRALVLRWEEEFHDEAEPGVPPISDHGAMLDQRIGDGRAALWDDGGPVSYVGFSPNIGGVVRVGPVYTPPQFRGHGYASALVAGVSQRALDHGAAHCSLYTDLANPTSNKIYAAVGYRAVADVTALSFSR